MLLKSLELKDFRQFKGKQTIYFAIDPKKNVTVIMGENGSGKTTLAQAFIWCLYGDTDFNDKSMLCKDTALTMLPNAEETVKVELNLIHSDIEYNFIREQLYSKDGNGEFKRPSNAIFKIAYKKKDGQREFVKDLETDMELNKILPVELSKYFFFDGERIENMSKDIRKGKSKDFAQAVRGLLGLSALTKALEHLKGKGSKPSVIHSYDNSYNSSSDSMIAHYMKEIEGYNIEIEKIEEELEKNNNNEELAEEKCSTLNEKIIANIDSKHLVEEKEKLGKKLKDLVQSSNSNTTSLLKIFNKDAPAFFAKKLMKDALEQLSKAEKLDKSIPDTHTRTIEFLIKRGTCLCGNKIEVDNDAYKELNKLLDFIPPQSISTLIGQFVRECQLKFENSGSLFKDISDKYSIIRGFENEYRDNEDTIKSIEEKLEGMENVGELEKEYRKYEKYLRELQEDRDKLNVRKGGLENSIERDNKARDELTLQDKNNRQIMKYKAYAEYIYNEIHEFYGNQENEIRKKLEENVNEIFKDIFNNEFSLSIDEKYNIQVSGDIETSTSQNISVIFAFISGVIKMARQSRDDKSENNILVSEPYPLVMDAPLSSFDKERIKNVCEILPKVAEQVIFFIKDTDGELAEDNLGEKVGIRYLLEKKNIFETYLTKR
jgi:DNA sulfur modification protein DndD